MNKNFGVHLCNGIFEVLKASHRANKLGRRAKIYGLRAKVNRILYKVTDARSFAEKAIMDYKVATSMLNDASEMHESVTEMINSLIEQMESYPN